MEIVVPIKLMLQVEPAKGCPVVISSTTQRRTTDDVPLIGAAWQGGQYAGLTLHNGRPMHLVLLPSEAENIDWKHAVQWADEQCHGELPSRVDQLVLFQNLKSEFKLECYWSAEEYADDARYAWSQVFTDGSRSCHPINLRLRARAVRRLEASDV